MKKTVELSYHLNSDFASHSENKWKRPGDPGSWERRKFKETSVKRDKAWRGFFSSLILTPEINHTKQHWKETNLAVIMVNYLSDNTGKDCYITKRRLSEITKMSEGLTAKLIRGLVNRGILEIEHGASFERGRWRQHANTYRFHLPPEIANKYAEIKEKAKDKRRAAFNGRITPKKPLESESVGYAQPKPRPEEPPLVIDYKLNSSKASELSKKLRAGLFHNSS